MKRLVVVAYAHRLAGGVIRIEMRDVVIESAEELQDFTELLRNDIREKGLDFLQGTMTVGGVSQEKIDEMCESETEPPVVPLKNGDG